MWLPRPLHFILCRYGCALCIDEEVLDSVPLLTPLLVLGKRADAISSAFGYLNWCAVIVAVSCVAMLSFWLLGKSC